MPLVAVVETFYGLNRKLEDSINMQNNTVNGKLKLSVLSEKEVAYF
jgi:hypothetical protein